MIVTGGCGFIGSHLLDILVDQGFETLAVDILFHDSYKNIAHLEGKADLSKTDIRNEQSVRGLFADFRPQHVYHLAAHHFIPYCNEHPVAAIETNLIGTQNIANACAEYGVEKLFFASTAAVYGISDNPHEETENIDPLDIYGVTKAAGEKIVNFITRRADLKVRIGRYFNAVGNRETNPHILPEIVNQLKADPSIPLKLGNVSPKRDYIHAADLARASFELVNHPGDDVMDTVNLGSGQEFSVEEIVELFGNAMHRTIAIESDPGRVRKNDRPHLCANISRLKHKYEWKPAHSLQQAIAELASEIT